MAFLLQGQLAVNVENDAGSERYFAILPIAHSTTVGNN